MQAYCSNLWKLSNKELKTLKVRELFYTCTAQCNNIRSELLLPEPFPGLFILRSFVLSSVLNP